MNAEYPHVTDILVRAGLVSTQWFTEDARERGSAVHLAARFLDEDDLNWSTVSDDVLLRLRQYQRFLDEVNPEILAIEEEVRNEALRYCGRLDRRIKINGREGVLDIKGPSRCPWHALQVMYYVSCFSRPLARWVLYLSDDQYRLVEFSSREDWPMCKAILTTVAWRERHDPKNMLPMREEIPDRPRAAQV
jgi:hypothetical protein